LLLELLTLTAKLEEGKFESAFWLASVKLCLAPRH
jgi:hypothetical protein